MADFAGPVIAVAEYFVQPIKRECVYLFQYEKNIEKLRNEAMTLDNMRAGVQLIVDEAKKNSKPIGLDVEAWLSRVDEIQKETELVLLTADKVENRRWLNYSLSRKAVKKIKVIVELQGKSKFDHVSYDSERFESRLSIMKDVMEALKDYKIHIIGICGMGGVGKTTMVKDIAAKVKEEGLFDKVVMAVVTQSPDLKSIQGSIAEELGLKLREESLLARAFRLCERLEGHSRFLVILDDVWGRLDYEELGIPPVADKQHGGSCTIMLTSRSADACGEMGAERIFWLEPLPHKEARDLFRRTADELFPVAEDIVKECGGLPLAIVTMARALRSKRQKFEWDNALQSLRNFNFESDYAFLKVSYEFLETDEMKHLFLLCCLFPQGYDIPIEDLLIFGSGLRLFTYMDGMDMTRTRANACLQKLKNLNLLLDSRDEKCVKMHDLVHTFALSAPSGHDHLLVRHGYGVMFWPRDINIEEICTKMSLWCDKLHGIPAGLGFPYLELLMLVGSSEMSQFPQNFYEGMRQLKVLIHRGMLINSLPISFQHLSTLQTLSLDYCAFGIECDLSMIGNLVKLEILSFVHSNVKEIPVEIGNLTRLRLLDLTGCAELLKIASGVLQRLIHLEELYMRGTVLNWPREQTKACLGELTSLSLLAALEIELPSFERLPKDMVYEKLTRFRICIGSAIESQVFQNTLKLVGVELWNEGGIRVLLQRADILLLQGRPYEDFDYPVHCLKWSAKEDFSKLRSLTVQNCHGMVYLVETCGWEATNDFAKLESMHLNRLSALTEIWHIGLSELSSREVKEQEPMGAQQPHSGMCRAQLPSFGNLRVLHIVDCWLLKYVFSLSIARGLVKLEIVKIAGCGMMEEIFRSEDEKVVVKIELPKLRSLKLVNLPDLACFCKKADAVVLPELVDLELVRLPEFRVTFSDTESKNHASSSDIFSKQKIALGRKTEVFGTTKKLTEIESDIPPTLYDAKSALSSHSIQSLHRLEVLDISSCHSVEVVFDLEALIIEGGNKAVVLNSLRVLNLSSLRNMTHVWKHGFETFEGFKNLTKLSFSSCDSIIYLFSTVIANFLVQLEELVIRSCGKMEVIVREENGLEMTAKAPSKIVFPRLASIELYRLPRLRCFCSGRVEFECPLLKSLTIDRCMLYFTAGNSSFQGVVNSTLRSAQHKIALGREMEVSDTTKNLTEIESDIPPTLHDAKLRVSVLPSHLTQSLHHLEVLDIANCISLEVVFDLEAPIIGRNKDGVLNSLRVLKLSSLQNMIHVWKHGFETFEGFKNLTKLSLDNCDRIIYLFSTLIANCLVQLEELVIESCGKMVVIVKEENGLEMEAKALSKIVFPRLTSLQLNHLPNLSCFCSGLGVEFEWPSLKSVKIDYCEEMLIFTAGNSSTPRLRVIDIDSQYSVQEDVNSALRSAQHKVTHVQQTTILENNNMNASWPTSSRSLT